MQNSEILFKEDIKSDSEKTAYEVKIGRSVSDNEWLTHKFNMRDIKIIKTKRGYHE